MGDIVGDGVGVGEVWIKCVLLGDVVFGLNENSKEFVVNKWGDGIRE